MVSPSAERSPGRLAAERSAMEELAAHELVTNGQSAVDELSRTVSQCTDSISSAASDLLSLHVRPGASVLYVQATRTSLLLAYVPEAQGSCCVTVRTPYAYQPRVPYVPRNPNPNPNPNPVAPQAI